MTAKQEQQGAKTIVLMENTRAIVVSSTLRKVVNLKGSNTMGFIFLAFASE